MSYAGVYGADETCKHDHYYRNCVECIREKQEKNGKRDEQGVLHAPNGPGDDAYCVGHIEKDPRWPDGDGHCTVLVRHCPVLNTPEQLAENLRQDHLAAVTKAEERVTRARKELDDAHEALDKEVKNG